MPGVLNDGTEVNLFALGGPVFRDVIMNLPPYRRNVPADMSLRLSANYCFKQFPAERWRKFMVRISCFVFFTYLDSMTIISHVSLFVWLAA